MYSYSNKRLLEIEIKCNNKIIEIKKDTIRKLDEINNGTYHHNELLKPIVEDQIKKIEKENEKLKKQIEEMIL